jgi:hypothetical protein
MAAELPAQSLRSFRRDTLERFLEVPRVEQGGIISTATLFELMFANVVF